MNNKTRKWIRGGIETLIHGGCAAFITGLTAPSIGPSVFPMFSANWFKMIGFSFAGNGGVRFFQWWQNNPLPPDEDSKPPFYGPASPPISMNPLSKVQPVPKE